MSFAVAHTNTHSLSDVHTPCQKYIVRRVHLTTGSFFLSERLIRIGVVLLHSHINMIILCKFTLFKSVCNYYYLLDVYHDFRLKYRFKYAYESCYAFEVRP